jgi:hypothetical protein
LEPLSIVGFWQRNRREGQKNTCLGCIAGDFRWTWLIPLDSPILLSRSQFWLEFWGIVRFGKTGGEITKVLFYGSYTLENFKELCQFMRATFFYC